MINCRQNGFLLPDINFCFLNLIYIQNTSFMFFASVIALLLTAISFTIEVQIKLTL